MRCRYCNKAISLLRRLNDAEYCTDAHRFADAAEQQLAMQRLAESQPAMQRTQRMAVAKPGRLVVAEGAARSETMTLVGDHLPFSPPVIQSGWQPVAVREPLHIASTVLFMDRQHRFQAAMPWGANSVPVPMSVAVPTRLPAAVIGQLAQMRIVIPRGLTSRLYGRDAWSATPPIILVALALQAKETQRPDICAPKPEPVFELKWLRHAHRRRDRELVPTNRLSSLSMFPAGPDARAVGTKPSDNPLFQATRACIPASRLTAVAPQQPVQKEDTEEFWTLLEASPLGALVSATHYPTVSPVAPALRERVASEQPQPFAFTALTAVFPTAPAAVGLRQPDKPFGLQEIGAPASVATLNPPRTSQAALEIPIAPRHPERRAKPAGRAMDATTAVLPVLPPEMAPGLNFTARPAAAEQVIVIPPPPARLPKSKNAPFAHLALRSSETVLAVLPPEFAAGRRASFWDGAWSSSRLAERLPAARLTLQALSLTSAPGGPIPRLAAAGARARPNVSEAWFRGVVATRLPLNRIVGIGSGIQMGGRVDCDLRPDRVDAPRRPYFQQTLQTMVSVRPPRYSQRLVSRYGSAECVPVSPPANQLLPWRAAIVSGTDLSPNPVFPSRANPAQSAALRHIPVRLYPVPRAKPVARPGGGKPRTLGMDLWASPPAICAPRIPFDDGKPRVRRDSPQRLAKELRERFSGDGLRSAWTKASRLPSDLKWIAMVVPLILGIWVLARPASSEPVNSNIPVAQETAPVAAEPAPTPEAESRAAVTPVSAPPVREKTSAPRPGATLAAEPSRWEILTARIANRASVDLIEDFHNGLSQWEGRGDWSRTWSYDRSGTVRPGQMAIFQPTIALKDYTVEMKASIDRRSIQWVVRASGPQNYHFARLNVTPGAPLTKLEFERWSVINGRTGRVSRLPLPHGGANQTLYTIRLEVKGDSITTYLQDQVIDTFSDGRLPEGGIGLIGSADDRPRIYGLHVSHQNDFLGKLCSFLAPPPINNQGSD